MTGYLDVKNDCARAHVTTQLCLHENSCGDASASAGCLYCIRDVPGRPIDYNAVKSNNNPDESSDVGINAVDASVDIVESSDVPKVLLAVIDNLDALNVLVMHAEVEGGNGSTEQGPDIEDSRVGIGCAEGTLEAGDNTLSGSTANHGDASRLVGLLVDIRFP